MQSLRRKVLPLSLLVTATLALTACGGDSASSGDGQVRDGFKSLLQNGNEYTCPTEATKALCATDGACTTMGCKLSTEKVKPSYGNCLISGTNILGKAGDCSVKLVVDNKPKDFIMSCLSNKTLVLTGFPASPSGIIQVKHSGGSYQFICQQ